MKLMRGALACLQKLERSVEPPRVRSLHCSLHGHRLVRNELSACVSSSSRSSLCEAILGRNSLPIRFAR
jgi:hypothetical protein